MEDRIVSLPAFCRVCGAASPSGLAVMIGVTGTFKNNSTNCRRCGAQAYVPDGFMQILDGAIRLFGGPDFTRDIYETVGIAVEDLRSGRASEQQAIARVEAKSKKAGSAFREWLSISIAAAAMFWTVGGDVLDWRSKPSSNMQIEDVVAISIEGYLARQSVQPFTSGQETEHAHWKELFELPPQNKPNKKNRKQRRAERAKPSGNRR